MEEVQYYLGRALSQVDLPLLGVVPFAAGLDDAAMFDFQKLFQMPIISGRRHQFSHYDEYQLVATGLRRFLEKLKSQEHNHTLWVTHAR